MAAYTPDLAQIRADLNRLGTSGLQIAVGAPDRTIRGWAIGTLGIGDARPVTDATRFQAASISKAISASAVLRLVEQGLVDLDADADAYLPASVVAVVRDDSAAITLRALLSHTAGINVPSFDGYPQGAALPDTLQLISGTGTNSDSVRRHRPPGAFEYSGGGYLIVQAVIESVTGQPMDKALDDLIFAPLGMHDTHARPAGDDGSYARGHRDGIVVAGGWHDYPEIAAAGVWTTARDLVRWATGLADGARGLSSPFSRAAVESMLTVHAPTLEDPEPAGLDAVGLGVFLRADPRSPRAVGHSGANEGYLSFVLMMPDSGHSLAVLTNDEATYPVVDALVEDATRAFEMP